ncbi:hypothetical protein A2U01_0070325, partial [Trifolium medium]|nr:hypothetical protein [Trifolium medium]
MFHLCPARACDNVSSIFVRLTPTTTFPSSLSGSRLRQCFIFDRLAPATMFHLCPAHACDNVSSIFVRLTPATMFTSSLSGSRLRQCFFHLCPAHA